MTVKEILNTMEYGPALEGTADAIAWLEGHKRTFGHFIDGAWVKGSAHFESANPATGEKLADIANGSAKDVDKAVKAARAAQKGWADMGGAKRARFMYSLARLVQKNARLLAVLETLDNGKPIRESRDVDVPLVARHFYHHAGWAQVQETEFPDHKPVGVVGQVIPWNFPLLMLAWKVAPALAMGNTVVLKPAEYTSLTALMFAELAVEAGLPKGVLNIVTGEGQTGAHIVNHGDVDKLAFTGSTDVGRIIREASAGTEKKLSLELGGKSPFIVFEDADLDGAVEGLVDGIWFNQGQVCCAGSRLLVQEGIAEQLIAKVKDRLQKIRVGNPLDKAIDMGAIVDPVQKDAIDKLVRQGVSEGAKLFQPDCAMPNAGCFYPPTLLTDVEPTNVVAREEIFGPVLSVLTFRTMDEAVELANNTRFGLAASIWSENISRALDVAPRVKAGVVWVNTTNQFDAACGFGGYRESGYGREGGREGLREYLKRAPWPLQSAKPAPLSHAPADNTIVDRTAKMYIGGKQARPDSGYTRQVMGADGKVVDRVSVGSRKDIRNAVEAAKKAELSWANMAGHGRAQILYFLAENLGYRQAEFAKRLQQLTGISKAKATAEVDKSIDRLFGYAAWADKYEGRVHQPPLRGVTLAMNEAIGTMGVVCPDAQPLLSFVTLAFAPVAMGNAVVVVPSHAHPLVVTDFYQLLETSDVPAGVVNIVTGASDELGGVLADHDGVDALWHFAENDGLGDAKSRSVHNLKRVWGAGGVSVNWSHASLDDAKRFLEEATQIKNVWIPYGE